MRKIHILICAALTLVLFSCGGGDRDENDDGWGNEPPIGGGSSGSSGLSWTIADDGYCCLYDKSNTQGMGVEEIWMVDFDVTFNRSFPTNFYSTVEFTINLKDGEYDDKGWKSYGKTRSIEICGYKSNSTVTLFGLWLTPDKSSQSTITMEITPEFYVAGEDPNVFRGPTRTIKVRRPTRTETTSFGIYSFPIMRN